MNSTKPMTVRRFFRCLDGSCQAQGFDNFVHMAEVCGSGHPVSILHGMIIIDVPARAMDEDKPKLGEDPVLDTRINYVQMDRLLERWRKIEGGWSSPEPQAF